VHSFSTITSNEGVRSPQTVDEKRCHIETISQCERGHDGQSKAARERRHGQRDAEHRMKTSIMDGVAPNHLVADGHPRPKTGWPL
jgi:hypothetical protein